MPPTSISLLSSPSTSGVDFLGILSNHMDLNLDRANDKKDNIDRDGVPCDIKHENKQQNYASPVRNDGLNKSQTLTRRPPPSLLTPHEEELKGQHQRTPLRNPQHNDIIRYTSSSENSITQFLSSKLNTMDIQPLFTIQSLSDYNQTQFVDSEEEDHISDSVDLTATNNLRSMLKLSEVPVTNGLYKSTIEASRSASNDESILRWFVPKAKVPVDSEIVTYNSLPSTVTNYRIKSSSPTESTLSPSIPSSPTCSSSSSFEIEVAKASSSSSSSSNSSNLQTAIKDTLSNAQLNPTILKEIEREGNGTAGRTATRTTSVEISTLNDFNTPTPTNSNECYILLKVDQEYVVTRSIQNAVWTIPGSRLKLRCLSEAWNKFGKGNVYLVVYIASEAKICGVARMMSGLETCLIPPCRDWSEKCVWGGVFDVEWIVVKDLSLDQLPSELRGSHIWEGPFTSPQDTKEISTYHGYRLTNFIRDYTTPFCE